MSETNMVLFWKDYCPKCEHYDETIGTCSEIHENLRANPKQFTKKCRVIFKCCGLIVK